MLRKTGLGYAIQKNYFNGHGNKFEVINDFQNSQGKSYLIGN
jgi:hypothetical protein